MSDQASTRSAAVMGRSGELQASLAALPVLQRVSGVTELVVELIHGAESASITVNEGPRFTSVGVTGSTAIKGDELQYRFDSGPCVDAASGLGFFSAPFLADDGRWPAFAHAATAESRIASMMSYPLSPPAPGTTASLNVYADSVDAFDEEDKLIGTLLVPLVGLGLMASLAEYRVEHLQRALETNRTISAAVGILMATRKVSYSDAFALLRVESQHLNRKLLQVADDVLQVGELGF